MTTKQRKRLRKKRQQARARAKHRRKYGTGPNWYGVRRGHTNLQVVIDESMEFGGDVSHTPAGMYEQAQEA